MQQVEGRQIDAVVERLGQDRVRTGRKLAGFTQDEGGVTVHLTDATTGIAGPSAP